MNDRLEEMYYFRASQFRPWILDPPDDNPQKTVVVLGLVRGGCSVVGAVLDALGVYMGPTKEIESGGTYENFQMRGGNLRHREIEVDHCNADHDLWGWKSSPGWAVLDVLPDNLRNLHGIFVYRDAMAVAQRRKLSQPQDADTPLLELIADVNDQYRKLTEGMVRGGFRRMVVSYQRTIQRPELLVAGICEFLAITPALQQVTEAIHRVSRTGGYHYKAPMAEGPPRMRELLGECRSTIRDAALQEQIMKCLNETKEWG